MRLFISLAVVALVCIWLLADAASAAKKPRKKQPKPLTTSQLTYVYNLASGTYDCVHNVTARSQFPQCSDGSLRYTTSFPLNSPAKQKKWVTICGAQCITANAKNPDGSSTCVGVAKRLPARCVLVECNKGASLLPPIPAPAAKKRPPPVMVAMQKSCFTARPTPAPTTPVPTRRPTSSPIPPCEVNGTYAKEFASLEGAPVRADLYRQIVPDEHLCMYVKPKTIQLSGVEIVENFGCSLEACLRWCTYAGLCTQVMYSPGDRKCYRANNLRLTDDNIASYKNFWETETVVYLKNTVTGLIYNSGKCNNLLPKVCNADPECGWKKGMPGENDVLQRDFGGWCGRTKCLAATSGR